METSRQSTYVWYVIGLVTVVNVFNYMDRMALAVLAPLIQKDLGISDSQLGLLVGFAFFLFYATCGIPMARWADRGVRKTIIVITLSIWSLMTALSGAAQNFWQLLAARVGLGAGEAGAVPASASIIADYVPLEGRPAAYAVSSFGLHAGTMLGLVLGGWLGTAIGWRWTFVVLGLPGLALAFLVYMTLREPKRGAVDGMEVAHTPSLRETVGFLWRCRTYRLTVVFYTINGFAFAGLLQWWPSFFGRVFGSTMSFVGMGLGLAIGAGAAIGTLAGGMLASKAGQHDVGGPLRISIAAVALALPAVFSSLFVASPVGSMLLAFLAIMLWSVPAGPIGAVLYSVANARMRATAGAVTTFCISVLGFGLGPFCVGVLSDVLAGSLGSQALRYALLLPTCVLASAIPVLYAITKALPGDLVTRPS